MLRVISVVMIPNAVFGLAAIACVDNNMKLAALVTAATALAFNTTMFILEGRRGGS